MTYTKTALYTRPINPRTCVCQINGHLPQPVVGGVFLALQQRQTATEGRDVLLADGQELLLLLQPVLCGHHLVEGLVVLALHHSGAFADVSEFRGRDGEGGYENWFC